MAITRLSGGLTPANGSDPRTFPAIFNGAADDIEQAEADIAAAETDIGNLQTGKANIINTDEDPGITIYVGSVDPDDEYTLVAGDVWIEVPA